MLSEFSARFKNTAFPRLVFALVISALMHLWFFRDFSLNLPDKTKTASPLQVVLAPRLEEKKVEVPPTQPPVKPEVKPKKKKVPKPPKPPAPEQPEPIVPEPVPLETPEPLPDATAIEKPTEPTESVNTGDTTNAPELPEVVPAETKPETEVSKIDPATLNTPLSVETEYMITVDGNPGVMRNSYQVLPDGNYVIKSEAEAKGLASLFVSGTLLQISEGVVTGKGLKPSRFTYQYGDNADKARNASFDWTSSKLTLITGSNTNSIALKEGVQDMLSFMYQFMFVPPTEKMQLMVTNGRGLSYHNYVVVGEEILTTKIGELNTLHILARNTEGDAKTELWLARDYYNLPVKMRKTEKNGSVIEQTVSRTMPEVPPKQP